MKTTSFGIVALAACAAPHRDPGVTARMHIDAQPTQRTESERARDDAAAPRVRELLDAYTNFGGVLSPDGTKLLFRSDRNGSLSSTSPIAMSERVFLSCGTYESLIYENRSLAPILAATGMGVRYVEARDGHNWENWRDRLRGGLSWLFPGPLLLVYE